MEIVAAGKTGADTVTCVSNICEYYTACRLIEEQEAERRKAREEVKKGG